MKKRIRKELIKFYVTPEEKELIQQNIELVSLLRYTSNNINQIAKRVNSTGRIYSEDLSGIKASMESLWAAANSILRRLASIP